MAELIDPISGGNRFVLLTTTVVMIISAFIPVGIVGFIQWRKVREREATTGLVHDMLARGFNADEIECVLMGTNDDASSTYSMNTSLECRS